MKKTSINFFKKWFMHKGILSSKKRIYTILIYLIFYLIIFGLSKIPIQPSNTILIFVQLLFLMQITHFGKGNYILFRILLDKGFVKTFVLFSIYASTSILSVLEITLWVYLINVLSVPYWLFYIFNFIFSFITGEILYIILFKNMIPITKSKKNQGMWLILIILSIISCLRTAYFQIIDAFSWAHYVAISQIIQFSNFNSLDINMVGHSISYTILAGSNMWIMGSNIAFGQMLIQSFSITSLLFPIGGILCIPLFAAISTKLTKNRTLSKALFLIFALDTSFISSASSTIYIFGRFTFSSVLLGLICLINTNNNFKNQKKRIILIILYLSASLFAASFCYYSTFPITCILALIVISGILLNKYGNSIRLKNYLRKEQLIKNKKLKTFSILAIIVISLVTLLVAVIKILENILDTSINLEFFSNMFKGLLNWFNVGLLLDPGFWQQIVIILCIVSILVIDLYIIRKRYFKEMLRYKLIILCIGLIILIPLNYIIYNYLGTPNLRYLKWNSIIILIIIAEFRYLKVKENLKFEKTFDLFNKFRKYVLKITWVLLIVLIIWKNVSFIITPPYMTYSEVEIAIPEILNSNNDLQMLITISSIPISGQISLVMDLNYNKTNYVALYLGKTPHSYLSERNLTNFIGFFINYLNLNLKYVTIENLYIILTEEEVQDEVIGIEWSRLTGYKGILEWLESFQDIIRINTSSNLIILKILL